MQIIVRPSIDGFVLQILVRVLFTHTHYYSVFQELGHMQMTVRGHAVHTQSPTHSILIRVCHILNHNEYAEGTSRGQGVSRCPESAVGSLC